MPILRCPVCGQPLTVTEKTAFCAANHSFDRARQGYFNLLGNQSVGKRHGDDRLMLLSRRDFLSKGYYAPLLQGVCEMALKYAPAKCTLLDVGCGEGYYTQGVFDMLTAQGVEVKAVAADISAEAAKLTAARKTPCLTVVASAFELPVADNGCDMILNIFSPLATAEFRRVLKPGGVLIQALPRERHLLGLKAKIYDKPYLNPPVKYELEGFTFLQALQADGQLTLNSQSDIQALFMMTPYYYKTSRADQAKLAAAESVDTQLEFEILAHRK